MTGLIEFVRFGYGPGAGDMPDAAPPDPDRLLAQLDAPEDVALATTTGTRLPLLRQVQDEREAKSKEMTTGTPLRDAAKYLAEDDARGWLSAPVTARQGFRERLVYFWLNRLTVAWRNNDSQYLLLPYRDEAIRPHVGGRFADMLAASSWHPAMLLYLDQATSIGPNSRAGQKRGRGLNENFAREFLELHSMGSGYDQTDVTELAQLFTGMTYSREKGATYVPNRAEPGTKTVLGQVYRSGADEIARLIEAVARRPETARNVSHALAAHFLAYDPPPDLVERMAKAYLAADTALVPVYRTMLDHPAAADPQFGKIRSPLEYLAASLRLLGADPAQKDLKAGDHLRRMGQRIWRPTGPDGWHDAPDTWISGPAVAARLQWAETLARSPAGAQDPRALAARAFGPEAADTVRAVAQAEQRWEGVAVLIASPDFMRR